ncbi:MAG: LysM peptidoglycan-binding domain-containing protein [Bacteroidota bacterium]
MGLLKTSKLEKMKIRVFETAKRNSFFPKTIEVMFNPSSYSLTYKNDFSKLQGINTTGRNSNFTKAPPDSLDITLIIDGTGVRKLGATRLIDEIFGGGDDVYDLVQEFLKETTEVNGNIHEPNFLRLEWGSLNFDCRMEKVTVNYTLFNKQGNPLRAELKCTFFDDQAADKRKKKNNFTSPDLTHRRIVKAGDNLLLMTADIYGSAHYYLQVAAVNQLDNFRNLQPGQELVFPPVKEIDA